MRSPITFPRGRAPSRSRRVASAGMTALKRANTNATMTVTAIDSQVTVTEGQTYDVDTSPWSELQREHPWIFEGPNDVVEEATAAPGTKRNTRR